MALPQSGQLRLQLGSLEDFAAEVVAGIVPKGLYGPTKALADVLINDGVVARHELLALNPGEVLLVEGGPSLSADAALFVGAPPLGAISYSDLTSFGEHVVDGLRGADFEPTHVAMVAHGPGFGLDGIEAFLAAVDGWSRALIREPHSSLETITYVERTAAKLKRLAAVVEHELRETPLRAVVVESSEQAWRFDLRLASHVRRAAAEPRGSEADRKRHVFVAMPFGDPFLEDAFYFGIQEPVREAGYLCERIDQASFTGSIIDHIRKKIDVAELVVAELSGANPNVYLEVGYAWGIGRPTLLLARSAEELRFDVSGQRALLYDGSIKKLQEMMVRELQSLDLS